MTRSRAETFISALRALEGEGDVEPIVACFAADAALSDVSRTYHGREGARRFWTSYRQQFGSVQSTVSRVIETDNRSVLIWRSRAALRDGPRIEYRGVSVLTLRGDEVARFETFYDSAAFAARSKQEGEPATREGRSDDVRSDNESPRP